MSAFDPLADIQPVRDHSRMPPSRDVESVVSACVSSIGSTLFGGDEVDPRLWFYISGDPPHECFQIVVWQPMEANISVQAAAIDTNDDTEDEMIEVWEGPTVDLAAMLKTALATAQAWRDRLKSPE
jgi:hypothetical protein